MKYSKLFLLFLFCNLSAIGFGQETKDKRSRPTNIILINADDLGYGDLGCYGQKVIPTPALDKLASEGLRFTQFYAGSTVCAPSRSVLMTGMHTGRTPVRGNGSKEQQTLPAASITVAEICKKAGYNTGLIGKWGLGEENSEGHPLNQGFDFFYGYLNQVHAHNHYPEFLWRNNTKEALPNIVRKPPNQPNSLGGMAVEKRVFANDRFISESMDFINANHDKPFFLYLALVLPHANNEARGMSGNGSESPNTQRFADRPWDEPSKGFAAMVTDVDKAVGAVFDKINQLGLSENTLILFTSDNGPHQEAGHDMSLFNSTGGLRGTKRALYEGGIRVPLIAWAPSLIKAGQTTTQVGYQADILPTIADLLNQDAPSEVDGLSLVPTLKGDSDAQAQHPYLYWEFYEQGSRQSVRFGKWKAIREPMLTGTLSLYDLSMDERETKDLASSNPDIVKQAATMMEEAHRPDPRWPVPSKKKKS